MTTNETENRRRRFRRVNRVARKADFARIYHDGNRARGALMTVVVLPNGGVDSRLGLSVGKRCWKGAVKRNRVRRVFREAFRLSLPELPGGIDVVLIASVPKIEPGLEATLRELRYLVPKALRRYREKVAALPPEEDR